MKYVLVATLLLLLGCFPPQFVRVATDLRPVSYQLPPSLQVSATLTGHRIALQIINSTNDVWRLDWNACSVAKDPSGWQSPLVDGQTTLLNKNSVKPPLVISPGTLNTVAFPGDLFGGGYFEPWPIADGGGFRIVLGFIDSNDKRFFCILAGNLGTKEMK